MKNLKYFGQGCSGYHIHNDPGRTPVLLCSDYKQANMLKGLLANAMSKQYVFHSNITHYIIYRSCTGNALITVTDIIQLHFLRSARSS